MPWNTGKKSQRQHTKDDVGYCTGPNSNHSPNPNSDLSPEPRATAHGLRTHLLDLPGALPVCFFQLLDSSQVSPRTAQRAPRPRRTCPECREQQGRASFSDSRIDKNGGTLLQQSPARAERCIQDHDTAQMRWRRSRSTNVRMTGQETKVQRKHTEDGPARCWGSNVHVAILLSSTDHLRGIVDILDKHDVSPPSATSSPACGTLRLGAVHNRPQRS